MPSLTQQCSETVVSTHSVVLSVFTKAAPACSQHPVSTSRITMTTEGDADHMRRMEDYGSSWRVVVTCMKLVTDAALTYSFGGLLLAGSVLISGGEAQWAHMILVPRSTLESAFSDHT